MKIYVVYDKIADTYSEPFCAPADAVAIRNFRFTMTKYDDFFVKDFELYLIGQFDNTTGLIESCSALAFIDSGSLILKDREIDKKTAEVENEKSSV